MDERNLEQLSKLRAEKKDLEERLEKFDKKPVITIDGVRGSSKNFPYTQHNCRVEGINNKARNQYIKMIKSKDYRIGKSIKQIEYELNNIDDPELRQIIRYYYEDDKDYNQTAHSMNELFNKEKYTADSVRMKLKRFFKKNKKN